MITINDDYAIEIKPHRVPFAIRMAEDYFNSKVIEYGNLIISQTGRQPNFQITPHNAPAIHQIYLYFTGNPEFKGDLLKGLIFTGPYGSGKTTLALIFGKMLSQLTKKTVIVMTTIELNQQVKNNKITIDNYQQRPLILDEIGRESEMIKEFGNERRVFDELIALRYEQNSLTFGTSNFTMETLRKEKYPAYIADRMNEMFNEIQIIAPSWRK